MKKTTKKHKPQSDEVAKAKQFVTRAIHLKNQMSKSRDEMRNLISDLNDIVESWEGGLENITSGLEECERGVDQLSEHI